MAVSWAILWNSAAVKRGGGAGGGVEQVVNLWIPLLDGRRSDRPAPVGDHRRQAIGALVNGQSPSQGAVIGAVRASAGAQSPIAD
jgi:hypothetical protein